MGIIKSVGYAYDLSGRLQTLTLPSGNTITYGYTDGKVTSLTLNGSTSLLTDVLYEPFGPTRGWTWGNGTFAVREYSDDGLITAVDSAGLKTYGYDDAFRITDIDDADDASLNQNYGYDLLDRLTSATGPILNQGWTYDANGNRLTQTGSAASTFTISSTGNRLSSVTGPLTRTYSYDDAGNTTSDGMATFVYNNAGRMISASKAGTTTAYAYNALGQRVRKTQGGSSRYFVYDEVGHLLGEYDNAGVLIQETVWFGDTPVATLRPNGAGVDLLYVHSDHLNTPRKVTRPSDNVVVWRWDGDPFGTTAASEDPDGDAVAVDYGLRFPGQYFDAETGLSYNYYRDGYDPAIGRYTQSDPIGLTGGLNTYTYVGNNPISLTDPLGLAPRLAPYEPDANIVCCVGGVMKLCMNDPDNSAYKCQIVIDSMIVHETSHLGEFQRAAPRLCAGTTGRYAVGFTTARETQLSELTAFNEQLDYLNKRRRGVCLSPDCEQEIEFIVNWILNTAIPSVINGTYGRR